MALPVSRRTALRLLAVGAAGAALPVSREAGLLLFHSPELTPFVDELGPLPTRDGTTITLDAVAGRHRFHRDLPPAPTFGYGDGGNLGPVITAHRGQPTEITLRNRLGRHPFAADLDPTVHGALPQDADAPRTVLHLHGGVTRPDSDGHPYAALRAGQQARYHYDNDQPAAMLWYHDHAMGITRLNVAAGLAAPYLLRDEWDTGTADNRLGLPAGEFELPLVLQEKFFDASGAVSVRSTPLVPPGHWEGGAVGDVGLVNGMVWPRIPVARGLYRFRLLNAGSYSVWRLSLGGGLPFHVIGNDGGLLDTPVRTTSLRLAPAERVDVLVDFSDLPAGTRVELRNDEAPPEQAGVLGEVAMPVFCRFDVGTAVGFRGRVPDRLRGQRGGPPALDPLPPPGRVDRVRNITINQMMTLRLPPALMNLNYQNFDDPDIDLPRQGSVEQWNLINNTPDPHPLHLHLVTYRILGRQDFSPMAMRFGRDRPGAVGRRWSPSAEPYLTGPLRAPEAWESGPKDTVRVDGNTVTRIVVHFPTAETLGFDPDAAFTPASLATPIPGASSTAGMSTAGMSTAGMSTAGMSTSGTGGEQHAAHAGHEPVGPVQGYVYHCHVLDHEDHEMMQRFRLVAR